MTHETRPEKKKRRKNSLELALAPPTSRVAQLERPQKVARLLEVRADRCDLVDQVLHAEDIVFPELVLDHGVGGEGEALVLDFAVSALVDEFADGFQVRLAEGVWVGVRVGGRGER